MFAYLAHCVKLNGHSHLNFLGFKAPGESNIGAVIGIKGCSLQIPSVVAAGATVEMEFHKGVN